MIRQPLVRLPDRYAEIGEMGVGIHVPLIGTRTVFVVLVHPVKYRLGLVVVDNGRQAKAPGKGITAQVRLGIFPRAQRRRVVTLDILGFRVCELLPPHLRFVGLVHDQCHLFHGRKGGQRQGTVVDIGRGRAVVGTLGVFREIRIGAAPRALHEQPSARLFYIRPEFGELFQVARAQENLVVVENKHAVQIGPQADVSAKRIIGVIVVVPVAQMYP